MPAARHRSSAVWLALAWGALVLYASLFPFSGWRWPPGQTPADLLVLPWPPWVVAFDLWSNFGGYLPLGLLVFVAARRSGAGSGASLALALGGSSLLSYATEVTQHFLPGRHPSLKDWTMNTLGAAAGGLAGGVLQALGWVDRWSGFRGRWFAGQSAGALALLALWPVGLLFPAPVPLGLGQVGERLRDLLLDWLADVPWAEGAYEMLAVTPDSVRLWEPLEGLVTALGLLAPCGVAFAVTPPGWRRPVLAVGALALGMLGMTLSTALNFGPEHALAWLTPVAGTGLAVGLGVALLASPAPPRLAAGLGLIAATGLVSLVAQAPADPYFAQTLMDWEQGRFVRFHGVAQWVGWLWPYAAMAWLLARLASRQA